MNARPAETASHLPWLIAASIASCVRKPPGELPLELRREIKVVTLTAFPEQVGGQRDQWAKHSQQSAAKRWEVTHAALQHIAQAQIKGAAHHRKARLVVPDRYLDCVNALALEDHGGFDQFAGLQAVA